MPRRPSKTKDVWGAAQTAAQKLHKQDLETSGKAEIERSQLDMLPLDKIVDRASDTRQLRREHVDRLAESMAVLGLLEPLVVDRYGRLLAGGHRKAAIYTIKQNNPEVYAKNFVDDLVPVRVMPFDASADPDLALQVEITENEKRRDYTPEEVRALADRLRTAGYTDTPGRPSKDEKRLRPALEVIVGKSLRSVRRYLTGEKPVQHGQVSKKTALRHVKSAMETWLTIVDREKNTKSEKELKRKLPLILDLVDAAIAET
jgi:ParB family transcriptional regulator, chromosome partitioning protein